MHVRVLFFAALRERAGAAEAVREIAAGTTVGGLWEMLRREHPELGDFRASVAFAVNQEYVDSEVALQDNDEVAF
ncbi:MAG: MoaD/ThiS family protein, partial [Candidatus Binatia bacterium]